MAWRDQYHRCNIASVLWCVHRSCWLVLRSWSGAVDGTALPNGSIQQRYSGRVLPVSTRRLRQRDRSHNVQLLSHVQRERWVRVQCGSDGIDGLAVSSGTVQHERLSWQLQSVSEWHVRECHWAVDCRLFGSMHHDDHRVLLRAWHDDSDGRTVYVDGSWAARLVASAVGNDVATVTTMRTLLAISTVYLDGSWAARLVVSAVGNDVATVTTT